MSPIGKSIQVDNQHFFRVVGVQGYKTPSAGVGSSLAAANLNEDIVIPLTTDRSRIGDVISRRQQGSYTRQRLELSQITVGVITRHHVKPVAKSLEGLLAKYHPKQADIVFQFLIETASLSLFGTGVGVLVGLAAPSAVAYLSGMETVVTPWSVAVASFVSLSVGIVFGIYPARRAARLDPIEALRRS